MNWPKEKPEKELIAFYGQPGENQTRIYTPYPLVIAWDTEKTIKSFICHELVKDSIKRVLTNVLNHYGIVDIETLGLDQWGGCLNVRPITGGTRLSMHAWGIAIDWNPTENRYRYDHEEAVFARPEYDKWWEFWEAEGWVSLGRERDYDWMHVQAARL